MSVRESVLGTLKDGREVKRYTITNQHGTEASFTNLGAIWLTMLVRDKDGKMRDVVLGVDQAELLLENPGHMGEPVGRNANRIGQAGFDLNGKHYALAVNDNGANNLHSGPDYWRSRIWDADYADAGLGSYVIFSLHSQDGDQGFPGAAEVAVTYTLTEDDALEIHYQATADQDTVFNMTNHAYFNLNGYDSGDAMQQRVWIHADHYTPASEISIPYGRIEPVAGTPMDFTTEKVIARDIDADFDQLKFAHGFDHNWVLNDYDGDVRLVASAYAEESGIRMSIYTDLEGLQFYTANFMGSDFEGKNGAHFGPRHAYCFETQHYPDCLHKPAWPTSIVKAGEEYDTTTIYKWELQ